MADRTVMLRIGANISGLQSQLKAAQASVADFSKKSVSYIEKNGATIDSLATSVGAVGLGLTTLAGAAVTRFAQFDKAMSAVAATGEDARGSIDALRSAAIDAGADTAFSAQEAAGAIEQLAKAGVSASDILGGGLGGALSLAAAGEIEVGEAAEIAASAMTQFNLKGTDVGHVADLLAAGAGKAQGGVTDMGQALNQAGLIAGQIGLSIEETTGALSAMASAGLVGSDAGTSLKTSLIALSSPSSVAAKEMERLGISAYDANGEFIGMEALAGNLQSQLGGLTDQQRNSALATIFGSDALRTANVLYAEGAEGIAEWTNAVDEQGYAAETAAAMTDNLIGDIERLGGSLDSVLIQSGSGANDALRGLVQGAEGVVDAFGRIPTPVLTATTLIAGGGGLALLGVAGLSKLAVATVETRTAMVDLGLMSEKAAGKVGKIGKAAGILAGVAAAGGAAVIAMDALTRSSDKAAIGVEQTISALRGISDSDVDSLFKGLGGDVDSLAQGLDLLVGPNIEKFGSTLNTIFAGGMLQDQVKDTAAQFENIGQALATMVAAGDAEAAAEQFEIISDAAAAQGIGIEEVNRLMPAYAEALAAAENATAGTTGAAEALPPALDAEAAAADRARASMESYVEAIAATGDPVTTYESVLARKEEAERATAEKTAAATGDASDSWEDFAKDVKVTTGDLIKDWQRQATEAAKFEENLAVIAAAGGAAMADELRAKGPEVAGAAASVIAQAGPKKQAAAIAAHAAATGQGISSQMAESLSAQGWKLQKAVDGTIQAVDPKSGITVTVNADTAAAMSKIATLNNTLNSINGKTVTAAVAIKRYGQAAMATGGPVIGPGTGTSDDVPTMLSNGEHVWTAEEVRLAGGHGAMYAKRAAVRAGAQFLAAGGAVGQTERTVDSLRDQLASARKRKASDRIIERLETQLDDARSRLERLREARRETSTSMRRGEVRESVTGGLSGAYSTVDELRDMARSGDYGRARSRQLSSLAGKAEPALKSLYAQADRVDKKLADAQDRLEDLRQVRDGVQNSIMGGFGLDQVRGDFDPKTGKRVASGSALAAAAKAYAGKAKSFSGLLTQLQKKTGSAAIVQEVAGYGVEEGSALAQSLLSDLPSLKSLASSYASIEKYGGVAGSAVARAVGGGKGIPEATLAVRAAQAQANAIDKKIGGWAKKIGQEMARSLGIKARAAGGPMVPGGAYITGEFGRELVLPQSPQFVLTADATRRLAVSSGSSTTSGGGSTTYNDNSLSVVTNERVTDRDLLRFDQKRRLLRRRS